MKGLLLAGGHGTRLRPLTFTGNKHMIPIANRPMLFYALDNFARAKVTDVGVILGPEPEGIREAIGDGSAFGLRVTFIEQGPPKGLAHAILCGRRFLGEEPFVMHLGDNLLQHGIAEMVRAYDPARRDAGICVTPVADPRPYGVVELDGDRVVSLEEKPARPKSSLALVGVYLFSPRIHPIVEGLAPSARGELEITDAIARLVDDGGRVAVHRVDGWWKDTGKPSDLLDANEFVLRGRPAAEFLRESAPDPGADVRGPVALGAGARIESGARVEGPVVIGARARVGPGAVVRPGTSVGPAVELVGCTVGRSILLEGARIEGPFSLVNSIVGRGARLTARGPVPGPSSVVLGDASRVELGSPDA